MPTTNVRISPNTHRALKRLAEQENEPMQSILDKAVEQYRRERFLRDANRDYSALRANPKAWKEELAERELWERTLQDGDRD